jgi:HK97 gp10 family phage protein
MINIKGEGELYAKLRKLPEVIDKVNRRAVKDETDAIANDLRASAPVDTGELRDSIQEEILERGMTGRAAITARHAEFVIHGTSDTPADDFVTPVENDARARFPKRLTAELNEEIRRM